MLDQSTIDTYRLTEAQVDMINTLLKLEFIKGQQDEAEYWKGRKDIPLTF